MLGLREGVVGVGVELVLMGIDAEILGVELLGEGGECGGALEGVMRYDDEVGVCRHGFHGMIRV